MIIAFLLYIKVEFLVVYIFVCKKQSIVEIKVHHSYNLYTSK